MKKIIPIFLMIAFIMSLNAQELQMRSHVEQFLKSPDKVIISFPLYRTKKTIFFPPRFNFSLFRCFELAGKDTMTGVEIYATKQLLDGGATALYKGYQGIIDYEEVEKIISWIETAKKEAIDKVGSSINYISYSPKNGDMLLFFFKENKMLNKNDLNERWYFALRFNKDDLESQVEISLERFDEEFSSHMKEIQKILSYQHI